MADLNDYLSQIERAVAGIRSLPSEEQPPPTDPAGSYTVRTGDTLSKIAAANPPVTWQQLAEWNSIPSPYTINVGQVLRLTAPSGGGQTPTPNPPPVSNTAAARLGWGAPTWRDDFSAGLTSSKWQNSPANGMPGHGGNGRRIASSAYVQDGRLVLHGKPNGDTAWLRQNLRTRYGRWEIGVKHYNVGGSGNLYHMLALIWPTSERWPQDGEYDWMENTDPAARKVGAFLHYPHNPGNVQQEYRELKNVDMGQFQNVAFEWTSSGLKGWVNGVEFYSLSGGANSTRRNIQDMPEGYLTLQVDNFHGSGMREAKMEVSYVNFWKV